MYNLIVVEDNEEIKEDIPEKNHEIKPENSEIETNESGKPMQVEISNPVGLGMGLAFGFFLFSFIITIIGIIFFVLITAILGSAVYSAYVK